MALAVGVPAEIKNNEYRVALTPDGVRELTHQGVRVLVQEGAGVESSLPDADYRAAGAVLVPEAADVWAEADLVCKVKEPQPSELAYLRPDLVLFTYLHLAAYPEVAHALIAAKTTGIAYETVQQASGQLPLLVPMSEVAGRMSVQVAARFLERVAGGRGALLGGVPGVPPARVVVLGAGTAGCNAAFLAAGLQADVQLLDKNVDRLRWVDQLHQGRITTISSNRGAVERAVATADVVIGSVLVPGGRAPVLVTEDMVRSMLPGSLLVDLSVDQGGCIETTVETSHSNPVYERHGVLHYAVGNIPGAVPSTSTHALTNATLPYLVELAVHGVEGATRRDAVLAGGVNTCAGDVTHAEVAEALGVAYRPLDEVLGAA